MLKLFLMYYCELYNSATANKYSILPDIENEFSGAEKKM